MSAWIFAAWFGVFGFLGGLVVELLVNAKEINDLKAENAHLRQELADSRIPDLDDILSSDEDFV